jgi:hypothetical protein
MAASASGSADEAVRLIATMPGLEQLAADTANIPALTG